MQDSTRRDLIKGNPTSKFKSLNETIIQLTKENNTLKKEIKDYHNIVNFYTEQIKELKSRLEMYTTSNTITRF